LSRWNGRTTATGPGSPIRATRKASWIITGIWAWWRISSTDLQIGRRSAALGVEWTWKAGAPGRRSTSVIRPTTGTLSSRASPIPVIELVRPGPGTTLKTPTPPVTRAEASAMTLAELSLVTRR